jgi:hypothetical protein
MTARMNARWLLLLAFLGCAPADASEESDSTESELTTFGRGAVLTGGGHYLNQPNVARELDAAGAANIPGVLIATHSTSPYMFAAQVEVVAWSDAWTDNGQLVVRIEGDAKTRQGKAARKLNDALNIAPIDENGAKVKRTPRGTVTCHDYGDHVQCHLGALDHVRAK